MKTVTINYYTIKELKELSQEGFNNAHSNYIHAKQREQYNWTDEVTSSLEKFLELFNCSWYSWDADYSGVEYGEGEIVIYDEDTDEDIYYSLNELHGEMLKNYLQENHQDEISKWDNCPLTGIVFDNTLLEPFHKFLTGEDYQDYSLKDLIEKSCEDLMEDVQNDIEYQETEAYFIEECEAYDWHFDINGNQE